MTADIRKCTVSDADTLFELTRELIEYHNMLDIFTLTKERLAELVNDGELQSYIAFIDDKPAGHINFFYMYSTFSGKKILYLEDLYVRSEYRKHGIGVQLVDFLKKTAKENDCCWIEWKCADFNVSGERFYEKIGAERDKTWNTYTLKI